MRLLFDLEANGLLDQATKVHCIGAVDVDTGATWDVSWDRDDDHIETATIALDQADTLIGHNILRYDLPLLKKLYGWAPRPGVLIRDSMVCGRLIVPNVKERDYARIAREPTWGMPKKLIGRHSLEAWGWRLGERKAPYDGGWEEWTPEMHSYMVQDVQTTLKLWDWLKVDSYSQNAVDLEHRIALVCDLMETEGVPFNVEAAQGLHAHLMGRQEAITKQLVAQFGSWFAPKNNQQPFVPKKDNKKHGYVAGAPCTQLKLVTFNPGSRDHIIKVLKDRGWKPREFTPAGKPELNEAVISGLPSLFPETAPLADYLMIDKRLSQLSDGDQAWLKAVKDDGRIHGAINPMGTGTSRASHFYPNLAQVPSVKSPYGRECRSLFYAPKGWSLLGADMDGLELRGLAHFLAKYDGGAYGKVVLDGDPHWTNAMAMGLVDGDRDKSNQLHTIAREAGSKRFIYAYIYGCGLEKAGQIIYECCLDAKKAGYPELYNEFFGKSRDLRKVGRKVCNDFATKITGFTKLKTDIGKWLATHDWLPGLDNRRIPVRSEHSALNFLIQSAGAILCKRWLVGAHEEISKRFRTGWDGEVSPVLWVHDEIQLAIRDGLEHEVGAIVVNNARKAGEAYDFRIRIDSSCKVGKSWADTH
jgi:DNA polymerase I